MALQLRNIFGKESSTSWKSFYTLLLSKYVVISAYVLASESTGIGFSKNPSSKCLFLIQVLRIFNFNKNVMSNYLKVLFLKV